MKLTRLQKVGILAIIVGILVGLVGMIYGVYSSFDLVRVENAGIVQLLLDYRPRSCQ